MMVKDPLDNGRTLELPLDETGENFYAEVVGTPHEVKISGTGEYNGNFRVIEAPVEPVEEAEPEFKTTLTPAQAEAARKAIRSRSFSSRNPHLGRMINCQVCGERHRENRTITHVSGKIDILSKCEQTFTNISGDYERFREDPKLGTLVPDLRTAIDPDVQPTPRQVVGAAAFARKRFNPHPSAWKLELVERTRSVFADMGFTETKGEQAQQNMAIARKEALRQIINERRAKRVQKRNQTKHSRRINWGLENNGTRRINRKARPSLRQTGELHTADSQS